MFIALQRSRSAFSIVPLCTHVFNAVRMFFQDQIMSSIIAQSNASMWWVLVSGTANNLIRSGSSIFIGLAGE